MDTYEINVKSEIYGETVCVVDISTFSQGRKIFSCADGSDYHLKRKDIKRIYSELGKLGVEAYISLRSRHQQEVNEFPFFFAFNNERFAEGMREFGLDPTDTDQICSFPGTGGYYRRSDADRLNEMFDRHAKERQAAIDGDLTGDAYIYGMFHFELNNHEYTYTYDAEDTLDALGLSWDKVNSNPKLLNGLNKAMAALREADEG